MTDRHQAAAKLLFFRETPKELMNRPPLASSQNLETSFLMIALRRYPHALISRASAVESALKADFSIRQEHNFQILLMLAKQQLSHTNGVDWNYVNKFRKKRNEIIHYGFGPEDDEISAILLLAAGIPLIDRCGP